MLLRHQWTDRIVFLRHAFQQTAAERCQQDATKLSVDDVTVMVMAIAQEVVRQEGGATVRICTMLVQILCRHTLNMHHYAESVLQHTNDRTNKQFND